MVKKRTLVGANVAHFVTFSTYGKRRLLSTAAARDMVIFSLDCLARADRVKVAGFVIMPDHVHALLWFDDDRNLANVMNVWKSSSSKRLGKLYCEHIPGMLDHLAKTRDGRSRRSFWQSRYHDFNLVGPDKAREKLVYMHNNPVKKGLCKDAGDWRWSSYRWYFHDEDVGVKLSTFF
ncbi:MAG: transposase [bacterium]